MPRTCSCGAKLFFARDPKTGKNIPFSSPIQGLYTVRPDPDHDGRFIAEPLKIGGGLVVHQNHFIECPDRDRYRRT